MSYPHFRFIVVVICTFALLGCGSDNNNSNPSSEVAVTGEFHDIQPADVETYVANYQAQQSRLAFTFDAVEHSITFEDIDTENDWLIASYDNHLLFIGFDSGEEEPLPSMVLLELNDEGDIVNQLDGANLALETTADEDIIYSGRLTEATTNAEFDVTLVLNESLITGGSSTIVISGTDAILNGDLGTDTFIQMRKVITENPGVTRLVIQESDGSVNDSINVHTGRLVREANLATHVPSDGDINSGAVDLFAAGATRTVEPGGILGVHSWCCKNNVTADNLSISDPAHGTQLTYFREMLSDNGEDFYFFTLQAAPFDEIHPMSRDEMTRFGIVTE